MAFSQLMTTKELSEYLGISYNRTYRIVRTTNIPRIKVGKTTFFRPQSVQRWLDETEGREKKY